MRHDRVDPRAHLQYGICRHCFGTGEVTKEDASRVTCPECAGLGVLP